VRRSYEKRLKDPRVMKFGAWEADTSWNEANWNNDAKRAGRRTTGRNAGFVVVVLCGLACLGGKSMAQAVVPFEVSNPKHLSWSVEEAGRIYASACQLVARSVRPEKPPELQPKFVLVLGTKADQMIRAGANSEIHLRKWDPGRFAEAMVLLTLREAVKNEDVMQLARETLNAAESTISVNELRQKK
jgi:hypothetical protein